VLAGCGVLAPLYICTGRWRIPLGVSVLSRDFLLFALAQTFVFYIRDDTESHTRRSAPSTSPATKPRDVCFHPNEPRYSAQVTPGRPTSTHGPVNLRWAFGSVVAEERLFRQALVQVV
jgi:hypothetical protein